MGLFAGINKVRDSLLGSVTVGMFTEEFAKVLQFGGEVAKQSHGVQEPDFIAGLAHRILPGFIKTPMASLITSIHTSSFTKNLHGLAKDSIVNGVIACTFGALINGYKRAKESDNNLFAKVGGFVNGFFQGLGNSLIQMGLLVALSHALPTVLKKVLPKCSPWLTGAIILASQFIINPIIEKFAKKTVGMPTEEVHPLPGSQGLPQNGTRFDQTVSGDPLLNIPPTPALENFKRENPGVFMSANFTPNPNIRGIWAS
jgi:hypothetical protein